MISHWFVLTIKKRDWIYKEQDAKVKIYYMYVLFINIEYNCCLLLVKVSILFFKFMGIFVVVDKDKNNFRSSVQIG